jgi:patatin-like phospholipase/acyl hydrolase
MGPGPKRILALDGGGLKGILTLGYLEVLEQYQKLGRNVFSRNWFRQGVIRARYDKERLESELKTVFGSDTTLGSDRLRTGLLVMAKRLDTGSP